MPTNTFFFDFDSTVVTVESLDEVLKLALDESPNKAEAIAKVEEITNLGMEGKIDFYQSLKRRLAVTNLSQAQFQRVGKEISEKITPGMETLMEFLQKQNQQIFIVSGGFLDAIYPTTDRLNIRRENCFANDYETDKEGKVIALREDIPLCQGDGKIHILEQLKAEDLIKGQTIMIGDGSNDLKVYEAGTCDFFCGFGGNVVREKVKAKAPHFFTATKDLQKFLENFITSSKI